MTNVRLSPLGGNQTFYADYDRQLLILLQPLLSP